MPLAVTVHPSGEPPSNSACHAASSSVFAPLTFSESVARLNAAPAPSVAEFASPTKTGIDPLPDPDAAVGELPQPMAPASNTNAATRAAAGMGDQASPRGPAR